MNSGEQIFLMRLRSWVLCSTGALPRIQAVKIVAIVPIRLERDFIVVA
jgi:hypothetical protein